MLDVYECRHGLMAHYSFDEVIGRSLNMYGEWAEQEIFLLERLIPQHGIVIDVGANVGAHSLAFSRFVGNMGRVISIEGQNRASNLLALNILLNGRDNIIRVDALAGSKSVCEEIVVSDEQLANVGAMSFVEKLGAQIGTSTSLVLPILLFELDKIAAHRVDLIKIDVEGMEYDVIMGARRLIDKFKPTIYFEAVAYKEENLLEILRHLKDGGYTFYWHVANPYNRNNLRNEAVNIFGGALERNILAIPPALRFEPPADLNLFELDAAVPAPPTLELQPEGWVLPIDAYASYGQVMYSGLGKAIYDRDLRFRALMDDRIEAQKIIEHQDREVRRLRAELEHEV